MGDLLSKRSSLSVKPPSTIATTNAPDREAVRRVVERDTPTFMSNRPVQMLIGSPRTVISSPESVSSTEGVDDLLPPLSTAIELIQFKVRAESVVQEFGERRRRV